MAVSSWRWAICLTLLASWDASSTTRVCGQEPKLEKTEEAQGLFPRIAPQSPRDAPQSLLAQLGFRMELLAAEPLVMDPVALDYDEEGRAWVVEMSDYPYTDKTTDKPFVERTTDLPLGRVRVLVDLDGDGRFDVSHLFADQLSWPTGLAFWKGGVFVAATPDIWYLRDNDGDWRADVRRKVFTGFRKFNVQAVMNNLKWGLDGRIYGAGSSNGGAIRHGERPDQPAVTLGRHDFRFSPDDEKLELISGGARFGNSFDDWGNRFLCNIRNPVQHVVLPAEYLRRNPHLPVRNAVHDAAEAGDTLPVFRISPVEPWRLVRARRWAAESGQTYPRSETHADGYFTSSSGVTIYRGAAYPPEFRGQAFLGEVAANAIHRQRLTADGVTFRAERADTGVEFVAATDNWFRPVNFINAPDGTLHVLDMYRESIEHPWSIPDDIKAGLDLESGRDRGRIYRLAPPDFTPPPPPRLGKASAVELVSHLANGNSWWRETAQRLLIERKETAAASSLREMAARHEFPLARLHALWTLEGLGQLSVEEIKIALGDAEAGIREHAVRLAETRLATDEMLRQRVRGLADDSAVRVRLQAAFSLNLADSLSAADREAIIRIACRDAADPWVRIALMSGDPREMVHLIEALWRDSRFTASSTTTRLIQELAAAIGARRDPAEVNRVVTLVGQSPTCRFAAGTDANGLQADLLIGLGEGLRKSGQKLASAIPPASSTAERLRRLLTQASQDALDATRSIEQREQATRLLSYGEFEDSRAVLVSLLAPRHPTEIQFAAVKALADYSDPKVGSLLLEAYTGLTPAVRKEAVETLLARAERHPLLLDALESRLISLTQITTTRRTLLVGSKSPEISRRAKQLFAADLPGPRSEAIAKYREALRLPGDRQRGLGVYQRQCANCHRLEGQGHDVGPNLETIRHRVADELLVNILDPNREVSPNYVEYVATLEDGRVLTGIIVTETPAGLVLRRAQGMEESLLRDQIESLVGVGKSLMPEGLEKNISVSEMADLLAYLRSLK